MLSGSALLTGAPLQLLDSQLQLLVLARLALDLLMHSARLQVETDKLLTIFVLHGAKAIVHLFLQAVQLVLVPFFHHADLVLETAEANLLLLPLSVGDHCWLVSCLLLGFLHKSGVWLHINDGNKQQGQALNSYLCKKGGMRLVDFARLP